MNSALYFPRVVLVNVSGTILKYTGAKAAIQWMVTKKEGAQFLKETLAKGKPGVYRWSATVDDFAFAIHDGQEKPIAVLAMDRHLDDALAVRTLRLETNDSSAAARKKLARLLKPFGWNVRAAVLEAFDSARDDKLEQLRKRGYVAEVQKEATGTLAVTFHWPAIRLGASRTFRPWGWVKSGCAALFGDKAPTS